MKSGTSQNLKIDEYGNSYTFNFRKFKEWKKEFLKRFQEKTWKQFNETFPNKEEKEALLKALLWFKWETDIFSSGRKKDIREYEFNPEIIKLIEESKKISIELLSILK